MTDTAPLSPLAQRAFIFLKETLVPGLTRMSDLLGPVPGTTIRWENQAQARVLETAFAGQESEWRNVQQDGGGPGRGFFQFEPPTCGLVLRNSVSRALAEKTCHAAGIAATQVAVYAALKTKPIEIAVPFARLDTYCDPRPLPPLHNVQAAWTIYLEEWRPGRPHPALWASIYQASLDANLAWQELTDDLEEPST